MVLSDPSIASAARAPDTDSGLTGLSGFVADVLAALGEVGVGALTFLETVFPPIPSEVVLPLAGFLSTRGSLTLWLVVLAATVGSLLGALALYALGAGLGLERSIRLLSRLPLVDEEDLLAASSWFHRHGSSSVFFGRLVPGVRSLVSLPAGADRMPLWRFSVLTTLGSLLWNSLLVGAGAALGSRWQEVERYAGLFDRVFVAAVVLFVLFLAVRRFRRWRSLRSA